MPSCLKVCEYFFTVQNKAIKKTIMNDIYNDSMKDTSDQKKKNPLFILRCICYLISNNSHHNLCGKQTHSTPSPKKVCHFVLGKATEKAIKVN